MGIKRFFFNLMPTPLIWIFASPYVAGDSLNKAVKTIDKLWAQGKMSTIDLLAEDIKTDEEVNTVVEIYLEVLERIKEKSEYVSVSLKPTSLGIEISTEKCVNCLKKILDKATEYQISVTMDMEDSSFTQTTLNLYSMLKPLYPNFGTVLQTRLFRTEEDIAELPHNSHIRLCIGIYIEPNDIAIQKKQIMKQKLVEYNKILLKNNHYVGIATHDESILKKILNYYEENKIQKSQSEFQFLLGVPRDKIQKKILQEGYNVRLYVPFATHKKYASQYALRRFDENPRMAIYVIKNLFSNLWFKLLIIFGILTFIILVTQLYSF